MDPCALEDAPPAKGPARPREPPPNYSSVVCKLASLQPPTSELHQVSWDALNAEIRRTCLFVQQVRVEASHVANLHVLRCCGVGIELPPLSHKFFYRICLGVSEVDCGSVGQADAWAHLDETLREYRLMRSATESYKPPRLVNPGSPSYASTHINELAAEMATNAKTMIKTNLYRRLRLFARFGFDGKTRDSKSAGMLVSSLFKSRGPRTLEEHRFLEWIGGRTPTDKIVLERLPFFVSKMYEILRAAEHQVSKTPKARGLRLFSLLPLSSSAVAGFIPINSSTLHGICARVYQRTQVNVLGVPLALRGGGIASARHFRKNRESLLRAAFSVAALETKHRRRFAFCVRTNGYAASVLLSITESVEASCGAPRRPAKREKRTSRRAPTAITQGRVEAPKTPPVTIGVDPGMRMLFIAAIDETGTPSSPPSSRRLARQARRKRSRARRKRRHFKHQFHRDEAKRQARAVVNGCKIVAVSSREFKTLAGTTKYNYWHSNLRKRNHEYDVALAAWPSFKTACHFEFLKRLEVVWNKLVFLFAFCAHRGFHKWRFYSYTMQQKALHAVSKRLVPIPSTEVQVGYGDWSQTGGIRGHPRTPILGLQRALKRRATVRSVDEFRTSKLCSSCHEELQVVTFPDPTDATKTKESWSVKRCDNSACAARFWDRDVNGAINILRLHQIELQQGTRPTLFVRGSQ